MTSVAQVREAIRVVQTATTASIDGQSLQREALRFLERFQNTKEAWIICMQMLFGPQWVQSSSPTSSEILQSATQTSNLTNLKNFGENTSFETSNNYTSIMPNDLSTEESFFAAQTLKQKSILDCAQLDTAESRAILDCVWREIMLLSNFNFNSVVEQQLVLSLAALIVQCRVQSENRNDLIEQLIAIQSNPSPSLSRDRAIKILEVIPEQLRNPLLQIDPVIRGHILNYSDRTAASLLSLPSPQNSTLILKCLYGWVRYGNVGEAVTSSAALVEFLFGFALQNDDEVREVACDLLGTLFARSIQTENVPDELYLASVERGLTSIFPCLQEKIKEDDQEAAMCVALVYVEAAEAMLPWFIARTEDGHQEGFYCIIRAALYLAETGTIPLVEVTLPFWSLLSTSLIDRGVFSQEFDVCEAENDEGQVKSLSKNQMKQIYTRLFLSLVSRHLPIPPALSGEERDTYREFRHNVGDCLKECVRCLGSTTVVDLLRQGLEPFVTNSTALDVEEKSIQVEALLFALRTISYSVDRRESEVMPIIASYIVALGIKSPSLCGPAVLNVGCYAEWARYHQNTTVSPFLELIVQALPSHSSHAGRAFKFLCESNALYMANHLSQSIAELYQVSLNIFFSSNGTFIIDICEGVAHIIKAYNGENLIDRLIAFSSPWVSLIETTCATRPVDVAFDCLAAFLKIIANESIEHLSSTYSKELTKSLLESLQNMLPAFFTVRCDPANSIFSKTEWDSVGLLLCEMCLLGTEARLFALKIINAILGAVRSMIIGGTLSENWSYTATTAMFVLGSIVGRAPEGSIPTSVLIEPIMTSLDLYPFAPQFIRGELIRLLTIFIDVGGISCLLQSNHALPLQIILDAVSISEFKHSLLESNNEGIEHEKQRFVNPAEASTAMILLNRILLSTMNQSQSNELRQAVQTCINAVWKGIASPLAFPLNLFGDAAALIRRYHAWDESAAQSTFSENLGLHVGGDVVETETWTNRYRTALASIRPRDFKETIGALSALYRRRSDI